MGWLQNILILTTATAFGFGFGVQGSYTSMTYLFKEPKGENFGGGPIWIVIILAAGIVGALIGFVSAVRWITQHDEQPWPSRVWIGLLIGLAVGALVTHFISARYYWWFKLIRAAFIVPVCSVAGGLVAGFAGRKSNRPTPRRRRR